jgi:hypothetical protein
VVHENPQIAGKLEYVGRGVDRLVLWTQGERIVWNCIECTHISNPQRKASPDQVRAEVWMALIHGSRGLIYFVHQFKPDFKEAALLDDPPLLAAVTSINHQIQQLAPVLNSPTVAGGVQVSVKSALRPPSSGEAASQGSKSPSASSSIAWMQKRQGGDVYLFTVNMRDQPTAGSFTIAGLADKVLAEVLGESRRIQVHNGEFADNFRPYEVHLYSVANRP